MSDSSPGYADDDDGAGGSTGVGGGPWDGGIDAPPEQELESSYGAPVATGKYVWIANPASGRVAYINALTLEIQVIDAGNAPTHLAAIPHPTDDVAIVLNVLSLDATVLRSGSAGLSTTMLEVPSSGNAWAISADGRWATAWTDYRGVEDPDPIDGFQDLTVLDLVENEAYPLAVGYRPVALAYDSNATRLFAVTQDGITVVELDLSEPLVSKNVELTDDPFEDASTRDVSITPDGHYALVRRDDDPTVRVFSLTDEDRVDVELAAPVTDLDLSASGDVAVAVVRDTGQVALLPVPGIVNDPETYGLFSVTNVVIGSVVLAKDSPTGFLYTNALPTEAVTVFDSSVMTPEPDGIALHAPVQAVFPTADGTHALILHPTGSSKYAASMSLLPVAADLPSKIVGLEAPPLSVAITPAGDHILVASGSDTGPPYQLLVSHLPSLQVEEHPLASRPIATGIVEGANRGFVAQHHPDGRITFVDFDTAEVRTLTGFELASQVVNGSGQ